MAGLAEEIYTKARELYKEIPVNARIFGESFVGIDTPITEDDFNPKELQFLKESYQKKNAENNDEEALYRRVLKDANTSSFSNLELNDKGQLVDTSEEYKNKLQRAIDSFDKTRGKTSLQYRDYGGADIPQDASWFDQIKASVSEDPAFRIGTTLGQFNVHEGPKGGLTVKDRYDWEKADGSALDIISAFASSAGSLEELGNVAMRAFRPDVAREVSIKLPED